MKAAEPAARGGPGPGPVPVLAALAAIAAARLAAARVPSNWVWGIDELAFLPGWAWAASLAATAAAFLPAVSRPARRVLERLGRSWERSGWVGDVLAAHAAGLALFLLRDPLRLTGDFGVRAALAGMDHPLPSLRALMYPADSVLNDHLARALSAALGSDLGLQLVGSAVGGGYALAACRILRAAGARDAALPAGFLAASAGALLTHFAGYDKFGPLVLGIALAGLGAARLARGAGGAWTLAVGTALAMLSHRSGYLVLPGAIWMLAAAHRSAAAPRRRALLGPALLVLAAAGVMAPRTVELLASFDADTHLPGGAVAAARARVESPLVVKTVHLLNALSLLAPLAPAALLGWLALGRARRGAPAAAPGGRGAPDTTVRKGPGRVGPRLPLARAAILTLLGFVAMLVAVEPGGGWARDWDVAMGAGAVLALITGFALVRAWTSGAAGSEAQAVVVALLVTAASWGVQGSRAAGMARLESLASAQPRWSAASRAWMYDYWGLQLLNDGDASGAARRFEESIAVGGPNPRVFYQLGTAHLRAGRLDEAAAAFLRSAAGNPRAPDPWNGLAEVALARRDTLAMSAYADSARARQR